VRNAFIFFFVPTWCEKSLSLPNICMMAMIARRQPISKGLIVTLCWSEGSRQREYAAQILFEKYYSLMLSSRYTHKKLE